MPIVNPIKLYSNVQRVSCCLCLLYLSMLTNAMFYEKDEGTNVYTFGPFALSPEQVNTRLLYTPSFSIRQISQIFMFITHLFYLSSQFALIIFAIYGHWPRYTSSLSGINSNSINNVCSFVFLIKHCICQHAQIQQTQTTRYALYTCKSALWRSCNNWEPEMSVIQTLCCFLCK
jgi:hypothetical protein